MRSKRNKQINRFSRYFSTDLSSNQARGIFFILLDNLPKNEIQDLKDAYYPIANKIYDRESKLSEEGWMI